MNIVIANTQEFNPQIGGVERVSTFLANKLTEQGHKVIFIAYYLSPFSKKYNPIVKQYFLPIKMNIVCQQNIDAFKNIVLEENIDIILNQAGNILDFSNLCIRVKEITGIKLISAIHTDPDYRLKSLNKFSELTFIQWFNPLVIRRKLLYSKRKKKILKQESELYAGIYKNSNATVLLSKNFIPDFIKISQIENTEKLFAIPNPVPFDTQDLTDVTKMKQALYVGRMDYGHKRPDRLLKIWSLIEEMHQDWKLIFVGDGPDMQKLKSLKNKLKINNVDFVGFTDPTDYYASSQIICMTSNIEGFPMVLVEASAYGVIPIAYNCFASLNDIIEDGLNGYSIEPFNQMDFALKLSNLMNDSDLRKSMAWQAKLKSGNFQATIIIDQWLELFNAI